MTRNKILLISFVVLLVLIYLLRPQKVECGIKWATCTYPYDNDSYAISYDIQPRISTRIESYTTKDQLIKYRQGIDIYDK